jgi:hypothetical protein
MQATANKEQSALVSEYMIEKPQKAIDEEIWKIVESQPSLECSNWGRLRKTVIVEEWRSVPGHPAYQCSNNGDVRSIKTQRKSVTTLKKGRVRSFHHNGAEKVSLSTNGRKSNHYVSRLIAICFIPNPLQLKYVKHKDGNVKNNKATNLIWSDKT